MEKFLGKYSGEVFAVTRIIVGVLFMLHGLAKFGIFDGKMAGGIFLVAGVIQVITGPLIALGFHARWAAFIASGEMAVAYFMVHFSEGLIPISVPGLEGDLFNHGETAVLYSWIFLYIASRGAGKWSVDEAQGRA